MTERILRSDEFIDFDGKIRRNHNDKTRRKMSEARIGKFTGENNPDWKGGKYKDKFGYINIRKPDHPYSHYNGYIREHRLVWEEYYNCCLLPWIDIHHKNGNKLDNRIENLCTVSRCDHAKLHNNKRKRDSLGRFTST